MRRVVISTDIASTSLTIPGVVYVVDASVASASCLLILPCTWPLPLHPAFPSLRAPDRCFCILPSHRPAPFLVHPFPCLHQTVATEPCLCVDPFVVSPQSSSPLTLTCRFAPGRMPFLVPAHPLPLLPHPSGLRSHPTARIHSEGLSSKRRTTLLRSLMLCRCVSLSRPFHISLSVSLSLCLSLCLSVSVSVSLCLPLSLHVGVWSVCLIEPLTGSITSPNLSSASLLGPGRSHLALRGHPARRSSRSHLPRRVLSSVQVGLAWTSYATIRDQCPVFMCVYDTRMGTPTTLTTLPGGQFGI